MLAPHVPPPLPTIGPDNFEEDGEMTQGFDLDLLIKQMEKYMQDSEAEKKALQKELANVKQELISEKQTKDNEPGNSFETSKLLKKYKTKLDKIKTLVIELYNLLSEDNEEE